MFYLGLPGSSCEMENWKRCGQPNWSFNQRILRSCGSQIFDDFWCQRIGISYCRNHGNWHGRLEKKYWIQVNNFEKVSFSPQPTKEICPILEARTEIGHFLWIFWKNWSQDEHFRDFLTLNVNKNSHIVFFIKWYRLFFVRSTYSCFN